MQKATQYILSLAVITVFFIGASCSKEENEPRTREQEWEELDAMIKKKEAEGEDVDTTDRMVFYIVRTPGDGATPEIGDTCSVSYIGYLPDGSKFEDSKDIYKNENWKFPYKVNEKVHQVVGLLDGIGHMKEGSTVEMFIHSDLAYGSKGTSNIPPFTTLIYRATLHEIKPLK